MTQDPKVEALDRLRARRDEVEQRLKEQGWRMEISGNLRCWTRDGLTAFTPDSDPAEGDIPRWMVRLAQAEAAAAKPPAQEARQPQDAAGEVDPPHVRRWRGAPMSDARDVICVAANLTASLHIPPGATLRVGLHGEKGFCFLRVVDAPPVHPVDRVVETVGARLADVGAVRAVSVAVVEVPKPEPAPHDAARDWAALVGADSGEIPTARAEVREELRALGVEPEGLAQSVLNRARQTLAAKNSEIPTPEAVEEFLTAPKVEPGPHDYCRQCFALWPCCRHPGSDHIRCTISVRRAKQPTTSQGDGLADALRAWRAGLTDEEREQLVKGWEAHAALDSGEIPTPKVEPHPGRWGQQHSTPMPDGLAGVAARGQEPVSPGPTVAEVQAQLDQIAAILDAHNIPAIRNGGQPATVAERVQGMVEGGFAALWRAEKAENARLQTERDYERQRANEAIARAHDAEHSRDAKSALLSSVLYDLSRSEAEKMDAIHLLMLLGVKIGTLPDMITASLEPARRRLLRIRNESQARLALDNLALQGVPEDDPRRVEAVAAFREAVALRTAEEPKREEE